MLPELYILMYMYDMYVSFGYTYIHTYNPPALHISKTHSMSSNLLITKNNNCIRNVQYRNNFFIIIMILYCFLMLL